MNISSLLLAAAAALVAPEDATAISCDLALPEGSRFQVLGHFDDEGLHSNLSELLDFEGARLMAPAAPSGLIITSDGTQRHGWWQENGPQKFDASLTQYGSEVATLTLERRVFRGRHWGRILVAVGLCRVGDGAKDESAP